MKWSGKQESPRSVAKSDRARKRLRLKVEELEPRVAPSALLAHLPFFGVMLDVLAESPGESEDQDGQSADLDMATAGSMDLLVSPVCPVTLSAADEGDAQSPSRPRAQSSDPLAVTSPEAPYEGLIAAEDGDGLQEQQTQSVGWGLPRVPDPFAARGSFGADDVAVSGDTGTAMRGPSDAAISAYAPGTESDSAEWQTVAAKTPSLGGQVAAKAARQPETSEAPTDVDLLDASDTGASADDDLTNLDNSAPAKALQFEVFGTLDGATVTLYSDGTAIGSAVSGGSSAIVTTNGSVDLTDGDHRITARQTEPGKSESDDSTELAVTVDTVGPRVTDMAPIPGSVAGEGAEVVVSFSEELHDPTVDETTVRVAGLGLDSQYGTPDDVLVDGDIVYDLGTDTVTFTPWDVLSPGGYGVWLKGTSSIRDVAGNRLDGEYAAAFPSGNGQPGGDFLALFQVSTAESAAPTGVDLLPASDTGAANDDDVTNLNNSGPGQELRFQVSGTVAGATVTLYSDGDDVPIGEAVAVGATTGVTTDGLMDLADGEHFVTARQTEPGKPESDASPDLPVTIDTQGPQVTDAVFSQDVEGGFNEVVVSFDEALDEASVTDATMKVSSDPGGDGDWGTNDDTYVAGEVFYDAGGNAATFTPTDPPPAGIYALWLDGGASIRDLAGNTLDGEYDGDFPSGDGTPGGHFAMVFDTGAEGGVLRPLDAQRPVQFRDTSGDNVTVTLQGPGTGTVVLPEGGDGDALRISLTGTTARSSLLITTKSTVRGVVAGTSVGDILITGSLKNLSAPTTDLVGSLTVVRGTLGNLVVHGVTSPEGEEPAEPHVIALGGAVAPLTAVTMNLGRVEDLSIQSGVPIKTLKAVDWQDLDDESDVIEAPSIGQLLVPGNRRAEIAGDFGADLTLSGSGNPRQPTLGTARIAGDLGDAAWTVDGNTGPITVGRWGEGTLEADEIASLKTTLTAEGGFGAELLVGAGGIGRINVTGGDFAGVTSEGSVGDVTVIGGDIIGSLISTQGRIGNITVKGVAVFDEESQTGEAVGGNVLSELIHAAAVRGQSIGNILLTGGGFGSEDGAVEVRATGDIGNIIVRKLRYKAEVMEDENERLVTRYADQGGGISADLDTPGRLGNLTTAGGDLGGEIHAGRGIGKILVESLLPKPTGTLGGIRYFSEEDFDPDADFHIGNLTARLRAEPGAGQTAIPSITVLGGGLAGEVDVNGKVGNVTVKGYGMYDGQAVSLEEGGFQSETFNATSLGNVTIVGGDFTAQVTAESALGHIAIQGGAMAGQLTARNAIGNVTVTVIPVNARVIRTWVPDEDGGFWETEIVDGYSLGGPLELTVILGGPAADPNPLATLGIVTGVGADVTVEGQVSFDPALARLVSRGVLYIETYDEDPDTGRPTPVWATLGGTNPTNNLGPLEG